MNILVKDIMDKLFFNRMFALAGIMMLAASICVASHDQNSNVDQPQNASNWSIMQNAVPKLFGAGLAAGGVYGAYVYSGALKRYVTEQPLSALAQATILGGGLLTNMWHYRKVNEFNQQRVNTSHKDRSKLAEYDRLSNWAFNLCVIPGIVYSICRVYNNCFSGSDTCVLGVCSIVLLANHVRSINCRYDNYEYDYIDYEVILKRNSLERSVRRYNSQTIDKEGRDLKDVVLKDFNAYDQAHNNFCLSIEERKANEQPWVTQETAYYESIKKEFNRWRENHNSLAGNVFYESVFNNK